MVSSVLPLIHYENVEQHFVFTNVEVVFFSLCIKHFTHWIHWMCTFWSEWSSGHLRNRRQECKRCSIYNHIQTFTIECLCMKIVRCINFDWVSSYFLTNKLQINLLHKHSYYIWICCIEWFWLKRFTANGRSKGNY